MDLNLLSPMYDQGSGWHFYVNELARLKSGLLVIPVRWVIWKKKVCCDVFHVHVNDQVSPIAILIFIMSSLMAILVRELHM